MSNNYLRIPQSPYILVKIVGLVSSVVSPCRSAILHPANLKVIETLFRDITAKSFSSSVFIPLETLKLLPSILQTLIR